MFDGDSCPRLARKSKFGWSRVDIGCAFTFFSQLAPITTISSLGIGGDGFGEEKTMRIPLLLEVKSFGFIGLLTVLMLLTGLIAVPSFGQATTATGAIEDTVTDQSNAAVPGASVTIRNVATGQTVVRNTRGNDVDNSRPLNPGAIIRRCRRR